MPQTILLIEDDLWLSDLYRDILKTEPNCVVKTAKNASDALDALEDENIDLVILDMFLPDFNGIEFLHELMSHSDLNTIPVIILSSVYPHDLKLDQERWEHYGVKQYLYKPETKPQDLVIAVKKQLAEAKV